MTLKLGRLSRPESIFLAWALVFIVACFASIPVAHAGIVSTSGVTNVGGPPAGDVHPGTQPTTPAPIVFYEVLGGVAPAGGIPYDHNGSAVSATPVQTANVVNSALVNGSIPSGTAFDSYLFHFDPADAESTLPEILAHNMNATITFSTPIIGVELFTSGYTALQKPAGTPYVGKLEAGDAIVAPMAGLTLSYYAPASQFRGLDEDSMQIVGLSTINFSGQAHGTEIDQVRIFVSAVPEPASLGMAFVAILGIIGLGRTRYKAAR